MNPYTISYYISALLAVLFLSFLSSSLAIALHSILCVHTKYVDERKIYDARVSRERKYRNLLLSLEMVIYLFFILRLLFSVFCFLVFGFFGFFYFIPSDSLFVRLMFFFLFHSHVLLVNFFPQFHCDFTGHTIVDSIYCFRLAT